MTITKERVAELLDIITDGMYEGRELEEYHSWDDLIECEEVLTFEEWEWCRDNMRVEMSVSVPIREEP